METYITKKTFLITCGIKFINMIKFAKIALDKNIKAFMMYINGFVARMIFYLAQKVYISLLMVEKFNIFAKCSDFSKILLNKSEVMLFKHIKIIEQMIK